MVFRKKLCREVGFYTSLLAFFLGLQILSHYLEKKWADDAGLSYSYDHAGEIYNIDDNEDYLKLKDIFQGFPRNYPAGITPWKNPNTSPSQIEETIEKDNEGFSEENPIYQEFPGQILSPLDDISSTL